jgi:hypothetical protein
MTENISSPLGNGDKYAGRILAGPYSTELKKNLVSAIGHFKALDDVAGQSSGLKEEI